ncbi:hypothetical protein HanIR_Chr16g0829561 [Helianthus annuus]|nr:hypothetical protein HanIR_Chr16g0829561 [Helianthus annuus]
MGLQSIRSQTAACSQPVCSIFAAGKRLSDHKSHSRHKNSYHHSELTNQSCSLMCL